MVPLTGLEPVRRCRRGIFIPLYVAIAARRRCGPDFLFALDAVLRRAPSSLYTFAGGKSPALRSALSPLPLVPLPPWGSSTEFDAIHTDGFPFRCSNFKSLVSADSTTAADLLLPIIPDLRPSVKVLRREEEGDGDGGSRLSPPGSKDFGGSRQAESADTQGEQQAEKQPHRKPDRFHRPGVHGGNFGRQGGSGGQEGGGP